MSVYIPDIQRYVIEEAPFIRLDGFHVLMSLNVFCLRIANPIIRSFALYRYARLRYVYSGQFAVVEFLKLLSQYQPAVPF